MTQTSHTDHALLLGQLGSLGDMLRDDAVPAPDRLGMWRYEVAADRFEFDTAAGQILGLAPEAALSLEDWLDRIDEADRAHVHEAFEHALDARQPFLHAPEHRIHAPQTQRWVTCLGAIERDDQNHASAIVGFILDRTTARRQHEQLLRGAQTLHTIFDHAPDYLVMLDSQRRVLAINRTSEDRTVPELLGQPLERFMPEHLRADMVAAFKHVLDTAQPHIHCTTYITDNGQAMHFENRISPFLEDGQVKAFVVSGRDVSERLAMERELQTSRDLFNSALDAIPAHLAVVDEAGRIVAVNRAWREFALDNDASDGRCGIGSNYLALCEAVEGPEQADAHAVATALRDALKHGRDDFSLEYPCHTASEQRWFRLTISPFMHGQQRWALLAHESITPLKLAELALKRRDAILSAIAAISRALLSRPHDPSLENGGAALVENLREAAGKLGMAAQARRVYVFHNEPAAPDSPSPPAAQLLTLWRSDERDDLEAPIACHEVRYEQQPFRWWFESLSVGRPLATTLQEHRHEREADVPDAKLRSILAVPVRVAGQWWGFLSFDDPDEHRHWAEQEIDALCTAADIIGASILQDRHAHELYDMMGTLETRVRERSHHLVEANQRLRSEITQREEVEQDLRNSGRNLRQLMQHMPVMLEAFDEQGNIIVWNRECERVTGYSAKQIIHNPDALAMLCPNPTARQALLHQSAATGEPVGTEVDMVASDGSIRTVLWFNISDQHRVPGWARWAIGVDVTARKKAIMALQRNEHLWRSLFETNPDGMARTDLSGVIIQVNAAFERLIGYTESELQKLTYQQITAPVWNEMEERLFEQQLLRRGFTDPYEKEYVHKDGHLVPISITSWLLYDDHGKPDGIWAIVRDLTDRRRAEAEMRHHERLTTVGTLAAGLAHEINNPLNAIMAACALGREPEPGTQPLDLFQSITREARRCSSIVRNVLQFAGGGTTVRSLVSIEEIAQRAIELSRMYGSSGALSIELQADHPLPVIHANALEIEQVLINVIRNAIDADATKIRIRLARCPSSRMVHVGTIDNGKGMTEDQLRHAMDPFFTTRQQHGGTGLGLSICHGIIREHRGRLQLESTPQRGTEVHIHLPPADEQAHGATPS